MNNTMTIFNNSKTFLRTILGVVAFILSYWGVQQLFHKYRNGSSFVEAAGTINKSCPIMVDQFTRLDSVAYLSEKVFQYYYTTVHLKKAEVDLDTFKDYVVPNIINNIRSNPDMKVFRDSEITMSYAYRDHGGELFYTISVTPEMYK